ncbi:D-alanyl-D-alanine carboxypeptidase family protein [Tropicimonas sp. IMCC6043]|uniref:D-alanyl-D-alanine carboxypeptidase family protein n=1 Tax=Tropicimonas sp. IMCC6043 TaxID=2510645 RepID=UPI00101B7FA3|nr:serine hydrolase [Tropicimonas sp. IMCC6043]RYH07425.1 D-alanyl-D-alanine carboxypeptidase [Tropicimonas sp. IMCC6043]
MTSSIRGRSALVISVFFLLFFIVLLGSSLRAGAAPYAAMVIDARSGEVLYEKNAHTPLHPASLTKMMTLYIAFEAVEHGEIGLDTKVRVSKKAANEVPSKLGLKAGQSIELRYLIRAAAVKSANDAATAIGEAISGSEAAFARRMNRTAKKLGMTRTTFKNANGLTTPGHLSTAHDMTILGRHLFYDYPEYYNLFSRRSTDAKIRTVYNTNRKFLAAYKGADGIKTGYTNAAGSNLVASAERDGVRIITTVFGASSSAARNAKVAELMDLGFRKAPRRTALLKPTPPAYSGNTSESTGAKTVRVASAVTRSVRPLGRPGVAQPLPAVTRIALKSGIEAAIAQATATSVAPTSADVVATADPEASSPAPKARPPKLDYAAVIPASAPADEPIVVTRASTSGGHHWGINVGSYPSRYAAERELLKTALKEMATLDGALRKVSKDNSGFKANFVGMTQEQADLACRRLEARGTNCVPFGPAGS